MLFTPSWRLAFSVLSFLGVQEGQEDLVIHTQFVLEGQGQSWGRSRSALSAPTLHTLCRSLPPGSRPHVSLLYSVKSLDCSGHILSRLTTLTTVSKRSLVKLCFGSQCIIQCVSFTFETTQRHQTQHQTCMLCHVLGAVSTSSNTVVHSNWRSYRFVSTALKMSRNSFLIKTTSTDSSSCRVPTFPLSIMSLTLDAMERGTDSLIVF